MKNKDKLNIKLNYELAHTFQIGKIYTRQNDTLTTKSHYKNV